MTLKMGVFAMLSIHIVMMSVVLWAGRAAAQPSSGSTSDDSCTNVLISMSPCLEYITGNSSTPSSSCCSQLASVVRSQPQCLCQVLNGGGSSSSLGSLNINQTQALALPSACNVQTPSISYCNNSPAGTAGSPTKSLEPGSESNKAVPSPPGNINSSGTGSFMKLPLLLLVSITMASIYSSFYM